MRELKIRIDESRSDKRKLRNLVKSIRTTVENMSYFPDTDFLSDIVSQIIINEDLDEILDVVVDRSDRILLTDKSGDLQAVEILIINHKIDFKC